MNAKISVFFISVESIIYLLLYNLHDCTFNVNFGHSSDNGVKIKKKEIKKKIKNVNEIVFK